MTRIRVELQSSALASAEYDEDAQRLDVTFVSGATYTHEGVPPSVFAGLREASSPGRYYMANIKGAY